MRLVDGPTVQQQGDPTTTPLQLELTCALLASTSCRMYPGLFRIRVVSRKTPELYKYTSMILCYILAPALSHTLNLNRVLPYEGRSC